MTTDWKVKDLTSYSVGQWEPNYDRRVFKSNKELHLFVQNVKQEDAEGLSDTEPTMIKIVELTKLPKKIMYMRILQLFLFLVFPFSLLAQDNLIINTANRQTQSLNGKWHYIIDPYETGFYNYRFKEKR